MAKNLDNNNREEVIRSNLRYYGRSVHRMPYNSPYDLLIDGSKRIEVKWCPGVATRDGLVWKFNLHRHGILKELCDAYIFRVENVPGFKHAIHLLFVAPMKRMVFQVSLRSLLTRYSQGYFNFQRFMRTGKFPNVEVKNG